MIEAQRDLAVRLGERLPAGWRGAYEANPGICSFPTAFGERLGSHLTAPLTLTCGWPTPTAMSR